MPAFGSTFYFTLAALFVLMVFMWRWLLRKPERTRTETFMVALITLSSLSPVFFLLYLWLFRR
ncbi:hypothetical protein [Hymenobacter glacialis]|uniref:Uncharacterized protein n=1 Tax=Hymenobacter glacialis TaxID=1908236 RepID=A0A1G1T1B8_9BACT|nr:hypothetical protein [Hymenobacter glacialis]OGX84685.1 hypothetical protein BEN48_02800 [Hymenobacter glacialis]